MLLENQPLDPIYWIMIIGGGVIIIAIFVLLVLYLSHRGIFSKAKRRENVFNFKEFINKEVEKSTPAYELNLTQVPIEEPTIEHIPYDIKHYLEEKGYITNYQLLSEEEKNKIMIELMILKNTKQITLEEYNKETVELWKK